MRWVPSLSSLFLIPFMSLPLFGQSTTWTGGASTDWNTPANWTNGVPDANTDAVVGPTANQPQISGNVDCRDLTVQVGTTIQLFSTLSVHRNAAVAASVLGSGSIDFAEVTTTPHIFTCTNGASVAMVQIYPDVNLIGPDLNVRGFFNACAFNFVQGGTIVLHGTTQCGGMDAQGTPQGSITCDPQGTLLLGTLTLGWYLAVPRNFAAQTVNLTSTSTFTPAAGVIIRIPPNHSTNIYPSGNNPLVLSGLEIPVTASFSLQALGQVPVPVRLGAVLCQGQMNIYSANPVEITQLDVSGSVIFDLPPPVPHRIGGLNLTGSMQLGQYCHIAFDASMPGGAGQFHVAQGASLRMNNPQLGTNQLLQLSGTMQADGLLELGRDTLLEQVRIGAPNHLVIGATCTLRMVGATNHPAVMRGTTSGDYQLDIFGLFEAHDYEFHDMGPLGVRLLGSSLLGAVPSDLRNGLFADGSAVPGSTLLEFARQQPSSLDNVRFDDPSGNSTYGVRASTPEPVTITNYSGTRSGGGFEDDPLGVLTWVGSGPCFAQGFGTAIGGGDEVVLPVQPIGFPFSFAGVTYSEVYVTTNGFVYLADGPNTPVPTSPLCCNGSPTTLVASANPIVAPRWQDLQSLGSGSCFLASSPSRCIITWHDFVEYGNTVPFVMQLILETNGEIRFTYGGNSRMGTSNIALVGMSPGNTASLPAMADFSVVGSNGTTAYELFNQITHAFDLAGRSLHFQPALAGYLHEADLCLARTNDFGLSCGGAIGSFYERFATTPSFDLANTSFRLVRSASGYTVQPASAAFVPPVGANNLNLGDDTETTVTLPLPLSYPGGVTSTLNVCSNGHVSTASNGATLDYTPTPAELLGWPNTTWALWRDFICSGAANVLYHQTGTMAYVTWNQVVGYSGWSAGTVPSTFQFQFDLVSGNVTYVFQNMDTVSISNYAGGGWLPRRVLHRGGRTRPWQSRPVGDPASDVRHQVP